MKKSSPAPYVIPSCLYLLGCLYYLLSSPFNRFHFPLDDAWIHRVYSKSFAWGRGFEYNLGSQEAGETSPLWAIITAPTQWFEFLSTDIVVLLVKAYGILLGLGIIFICSLILKHFGIERLRVIAACSLIALDPRLIFSSLSGMETLLAVFLWLASFYFFLKNNFITSAIFCGLAPTARPECAILLPLWALCYFLNRKPDSKFILNLGLLALPGILWVVFCLFTNNHLLPNTFYAKATSFNFDLVTLQKLCLIISEYGFSSYTLIFSIGILLFLRYILKYPSKDKTYILLWLLLTPCLYLFAIAGSRTLNPTGYYWERWFDPAILILSIASIFAISSFTFKTTKISLRYRLPHYFIILSFLLYLPSYVQDIAERNLRLTTDSQAIDRLNVQTGKWLAVNTNPNDKVIAQDAGAIKYFSNRHIIDLLGLNNKEIMFKTKLVKEFIVESKWLVVYPLMLDNSPRKGQFELEQSFPLEDLEYTICKCPEIKEKNIYRKTKDLYL